MRYRVIAPAELDGGLVSRWLKILSERPDLSGPYFHPTFAREVGRVRPKTRVTVIEDREVVGFLGFELGAWGLGRALAGPLSDAHGVVSVPGTEWSAVDLVRASGLSGWDFDHLVPDHDRFAAFGVARAVSPIIDLSGGMDAYLASIKAGRLQQRKKTLLKMQKDVGPVEFTVVDRSHATLETLLRWKSEQCHSTGIPDMFGMCWTRDLMHNLLDVVEPGFSGVLSALVVGGRPAALHMGMRSATVWHWWFPSYNHEFARYSPGSCLLVRSIEEAPAMGIRVIDLGKGDALYKREVSNAGTLLLEGRVETWGLTSRVRSQLARIEAATDRHATKIMAIPFRAWRRWVRRQKYR
ncbi:MAG: GNAT family N-acetyltransferase [Candidatus Hydrogenedentes bacterium]|nr:GNAT family N-acetyltransferase [Candidatus Hydrogenedentota bacterium]